MKIATWNVNGIRARQDEVAAFVTREQPDVLCLQEIKATRDHIPKTVCDLPGYWCYWHGTKGYSGVALVVRKEIEADRPMYIHPDFDVETRIATVRVAGTLVASIYVPERRQGLRGQGPLPGGDGRLRGRAAGHRRSRRAVRRHQHRAHGDGRASEGTRQPRRGTALGRARAVRTHPGRRAPCTTSAASRIPTNDALFTWWAPWRNMRQRNIGWRLDYVLASGSLAARTSRCVSMREYGTSDHAPVVATFGNSSSPS